MAWIKRNLYFVITIVVGLGLTGYCCYLFMSGLSANSVARDAYNQDTNSLHQLQVQKPYPSKENIQAAEADADRVREFKGEFLKIFAGFPTPAKVDNQQFNDFLNKTIIQFGAEATNAGVSLNPGYDFGFNQQKGVLEYPPECLDPWMQELEEMHTILGILYNAKINFLEHIQRPLVSPNDTSEDSTPLHAVTNQTGVSTPYTVEFRGFSAEIANVLAGFARSSNCFIVKAPFVVKSTVPLPDANQFQPPPVQPAPQYIRPPIRYPSENSYGGRDPSDRRGSRRMEEPRAVQSYVPAAAAAAPAQPVTILTEKPLFVTLYIDVVKLKALETNAPAVHSQGRPGRKPER